MSIRLKFFSIFCTVALALILTSYWILQSSQQDLIQAQAQRIAKIVTTQVLADREVYAKSLVDKLENDGVGADAKAHFRPGYIMLPAQFVRRVARRVEKTAGDLYSYSLVSRWNINPKQKLADSFEKEAWANLASQGVRLTNNARAQLANWEPVSAIVTIEGEPVLRYMQADVARSNSCVNCHNAYEKTVEIMAMRNNAGETDAKVWQLNDLMGAVQVDVPLTAITGIAEDSRFTLLAVLIFVFLAGFLIINLFVYEWIVKPSQEVSRLKGEFLANMSHELRTPLNGVVGMTEFLSESSPTAEQKGYIQTLKQSSESLLDIVNDVLDFSKIEGGQLKLELLPFNLREMLQEIAEQALPISTDKGLEVLIDYPLSLPEIIVADRSRLRQIILNLMSNALKFTTKGHILICAKEKKKNDQSWLELSVADTGLGVAKTKQQKIFEQFMQADDSTTRKFGGTGLGLAISKKLVDLMGGTISVDSQLSEGSVFKVAVPLIEGDSSTEVGAPHSLSEDLLFGTRALIVDDNKASADILNKMLRHAGAEVAVATSAEEAMVMLEQGVAEGALPDFIVIDQVMPAVQGDELGLRIKAKASLKQVPLMIVTSLPLRGEAETRQEQGFAAYLSKPLNTIDFLEISAKILDRKSEVTDASAEILTTFKLHREKDDGWHARAGFGGAKVLLAEDNAVNALVATKMLEQLGLDVTLANNGAEAVEQAEAQQFNLILMDYHMPEMDGLEATRRLRDSGHKIPIIALSAAVLEEEREACKKAGMNGFLAKPLKKAALKSTLSTWLGFDD